MTTAKKTAPAKKTTSSRSSSKTTSTAQSQPSSAEAERTGSGDTTEVSTAANTGAGDTGAETTATGDSGTQEVSTGPTGRSNLDSGPGTGTPAPPEQDARPPATIVNSDPGAAPLDPPADSGTQTEPKLGYQTSTTDQAYAETAGRTIAGENHQRLLDDEGNELSADDLFEDEDPNKTYVVTARRITEEFTYPNTTRTSARLMYVKGARVPRFQAERIKAAVRQAAEAEPVTSAESEGAGTLRNP